MEASNFNGRVSDIQKIKEYKKVESELLYNNYKDNSLKGIIESSKMSDYFFSMKNREDIQQNIRYNVFKNTDKVISKQSDEEIYTIMRSIYLQKGGLRFSTHDEMLEIIKGLNGDVIDYSVKNVTNTLKQHDMYLNDISKLPIPLENPKYDKKNTTYDMSNLM
tara:strand:+ start:1466 stop:1954 length:489 start_codon:yes stop_codon:yes gene_type:complete